MAKEEESPILVEQHVDRVSIQVPFDRSIAQLMYRVGAEFDKEKHAWVVGNDVDVGKLVKLVEFEMEASRKDRDDIAALAQDSASSRVRANGHESGVVISDYHSQDGHSGEILNVNGRYAAQLTGFGKEDGAAFVAIHKLSDLSAEVYKGDNVHIRYDEKGVGQVTDRSLYRSADGVSVQKVDDVIRIKTSDFNQEMANRIRRVEGAGWNKEAEAFDVPVDKEYFVTRAVSEMRKIYRESEKEMQQLKETAGAKIDHANVKPAWTKEGKNFGPILGVTERFVMQHTGKNEFCIHRRDNLDASQIEVGQNLKIEYRDGKGQVTDRSQEKSRSHTR